MANGRLARTSSQQFKPELYYGVAPFPAPADHPELANTSVLEGTVAMIPSGSPNQAAAADLLAWMMSPQILADEMVANYNLPTDQSFRRRPALPRQRRNSRLSWT